MTCRDFLLDLKEIPLLLHLSVHGAFLLDQVESLYRSYYILREFYNQQNILIHQIKVATGTVWATDEMVLDAVKKAVADQEKYEKFLNK